MVDLFAMVVHHFCCENSRASYFITSEMFEMPVIFCLLGFLMQYIN